MGFLRRLFGFEQTGILAPGRGWIVPVVGESHYQDALQMLYRKNGGSGHDIKVSAMLVPENDNAFDTNAVRIKIESRRVGHLAREMALQYRAALGKTWANAAPK